MTRFLYEHRSYDMTATWVYLRDRQRVESDPDRRTWRDFDRMREALAMVVTPWYCRSCIDDFSV